MPEEKTVGSVPDGDVHTKDGSESAGAGSSEETIFDNKTPEEIKALAIEKDKEHRELSTKMGQISGELSELRNFRKDAEGESKLAEAVTAVKDMVADNNKEPKLDYDAWEAGVLAEYEENPQEALKKFMRARSSWAAEDLKGVEDKYGKLVSELQSQIGTLTEAYQTTTDDYKENRELIDTLRKDTGLSVAKATALAKTIRDQMPEAQRTTPPSGIDPTRTIVPDSKKQTEARYSAEEIAEMKARLPDDVVDALIEKANRDSNLTDKEKEDF